MEQPLTTSIWPSKVINVLIWRLSHQSWTIKPRSQSLLATRIPVLSGLPDSGFWNLLPKCVNEHWATDAQIIQNGTRRISKKSSEYAAYQRKHNSLVDWNLQRSSGRQGLEDSHGDVVHLLSRLYRNKCIKGKVGENIRFIKRIFKGSMKSICLFFCLCCELRFGMLVS